MDTRSALMLLEKARLTDFQKEVLRATADVPEGETRTYRQIAEAIGKPNAYRAVGTALRKNPYPVSIPCHRIIRSDGRIGKYGGRLTGKKRDLLVKEGAVGDNAAL